MKRADKDAYLESYERDRSDGVPYFPDVMFRDVLASLVILLVLIGLAAAFSAPLDEQADPLDSSYLPRPEWYFLFLFQLLKYFSGEAEVFGVVVIPIAATVFLLLLPFLDRSPRRYYMARPVPVVLTYLLLAGAVFLTARAALDAPPPAIASELPAPGTDPIATGADLYAVNCAACHGPQGEGGPNPAQPGDTVAPISTAEYLATRGDATLTAIIEQGQPSFGMAPFGRAFGGPLNDDDVSAVVAFLRAWEDDPPMVLSGDVAVAALSQSADYLYPELCAQCHGPNGEGGIGPAFTDAGFQSQTDQEIFDSINLGHPATPMIAWGQVLNAAQIEGLVRYLRGFDAAATAGPVGFEADILPMFSRACNACHGAAGGWDGTTYEGALLSGDHAPVIVPGDPDASLLLQMMRGTHPDGVIMPPGGLLPARDIELVAVWIAAGAPL